jgi:cytochrome c peroxidase
MGERGAWGIAKARAGAAAMHAEPRRAGRPAARRRGRALLAAGIGLLFAACLGLGRSRPTSFPTPPQENPDFVQRGGILFIDPRISADGKRSCAGCHAPQTPGRLLFEGAIPAEPGAAGARVAPALRGLFTKDSFLWDGSSGSLEQVVDRMLAVEMGGAQLDAPNRAALLAYLRSIPAYDNGRIEPDGTPIEPSTISQRNGYRTFMEECASCHPPATFRRGLKFDIGTGGSFSVPTLRGLPRAGPYGHDGRWPTLEAALQAILENRELELTFRQRLELIEYLKLL